MRWKQVAISLVVVFLLFSLLSGLALKEESQAVSVLDFKAPSSRGEFNITQHLDKPFILLNFWVSWCFSCEEEMPFLEHLFQENHDRLLVVGINPGDTYASMLSTVQRWNLSFPNLFDSSKQIGNMYGVNGIPHTVLLSNESILLWEKKGPLTSEDIAHIQKIIS